MVGGPRTTVLAALTTRSEGARGGTCRTTSRTPIGAVRARLRGGLAPNGRMGLRAAGIRGARSASGASVTQGPSRVRGTAIGASTMLRRLRAPRLPRMRPSRAAFDGARGVGNGTHRGAKGSIARQARLGRPRGSQVGSRGRSRGASIRPGRLARARSRKGCATSRIAFGGAEARSSPAPTTRVWSTSRLAT